jgi:hypothetical protein
MAYSFKRTDPHLLSKVAVVVWRRNETGNMKHVDSYGMSIVGDELSQNQALVLWTYFW